MATARKSKKAATATVVAKPELQISDLEAGEVFSEMSHYQVVSTESARKLVTLRHIETNENVNLTFDYVKNILKSADHYFTEVRVGKEDKMWTQKQIDDAKAKGELSADTSTRVGDVRVKGIRSIFEGIYTEQVFTVVYETQPTKRTQKEFNELRLQQATEAENEINKAKKNKKGMGAALLDILAKVQDNPITDMIPGHDKTLRGYKVQFDSRDGRYNCVDLDETDVHNTRPVNINTIKELCLDGVRYIVE